MSYKEPMDTSHSEIEIKKSRFIGFAQKALTRHEAMDFIKELKESYPDARHICWGYLIGDPQNSTNSGCNDDGEPSGTAGRPILAQIKYSNIGNVVVAIVRYFGGIRLGAGGLVRAYRESAQNALKALDVADYVLYTEVTLVCPFKEESEVRRLIADHYGQVLSEAYEEGVTVQALFPEANINKLKQGLLRMSASVVEKD